MIITEMDPTEVRNAIVSVLTDAGYRPFGSDGAAWEAPDGTKVTYGFAGGQPRVRRYAPGNSRFERIPAVVWDIKQFPTEAEIAQFLGKRPPAPDLSPEEMMRVHEFIQADPAPESFRQRVIEAIGMELKMGRYDEVSLANAVLRVIGCDK
jgi:hypothetical protein